MCLKQQKNVIVDATHMTKALRASWYPVTKELLYVKTNIVWVYADKDPQKNLEICIERSRKSVADEIVPYDVLCRMANQFEPPDYTSDYWANTIIEYRNVEKDFRKK